MFTHIRQKLLSPPLFFLLLVCGMACTALAVPAPVWSQSTSEEDMLVDKARFTLENIYPIGVREREEGSGWALS